VKLYFHIFVSSAQDGGKWLALNFTYLIPGERAPNMHWIGYVGPRTDLDMIKKEEDPCLRFDVLTLVKILTVIFWVVMP
jgi:hypothetical protein